MSNITSDMTMSQVAQSVAETHAALSQAKAQAKLDAAERKENAEAARKARDKRDREIVRVVGQTKPENRPAVIARQAEKHGINEHRVRAIAIEAGVIEKGERVTGAEQAKRDQKVLKAFNGPGKGSLRKTGELIGLPTSTVYSIVKRAGLMEGRTRQAAPSISVELRDAISAAIAEHAPSMSAQDVLKAIIAGRVDEPASEGDQEPTGEQGESEAPQDAPVEQGEAEGAITDDESYDAAGRPDAGDEVHGTLNIATGEVASDAPAAE